MKKLLHKELFLSAYLPALLCIGSFIWKYNYIDLRDIALDEPFTIYYAQNSITDIWNLSLSGEPNPPLFMLIIHFWINLFGIEAASVRLVPLLFNSLTILFLYQAARKIAGNAAAIIASGLFIFSTLHFYFSLETRTYPLISLCTAAAFYFYTCLQHEPENRKWFIGLFIANLCMVYSHYFSWLILLNEFVFTLLIYHRKTFLKRICINLLLVFVAYTPITYAVIKQFLKSSKGTWVTPPVDGQWLNEIYFWLNGKTNTQWIIYLLIAGIVIVVLRYAFKKCEPENERLKVLLFTFCWFLLPFVLMYTVSFTIPLFVNRYILFNSIGLYLFIGAGVQLSFGFYKPLLLAVAVFILHNIIVSNERLPEYFYYREVKNGVSWVDRHKDTNTIVLIFPVWSDLEFTYHHDRFVFKKPKPVKDTLMERQQIFPISSVDGTPEFIEKMPFKYIILYENGVEGTEGSVALHRYLDSTYSKTDSLFFPQCIFVNRYKRK